MDGEILADTVTRSGSSPRPRRSAAAPADVLAALMERDGTFAVELAEVICMRGYQPEGTPVDAYPREYASQRSRTTWTSSDGSGVAPNSRAIVAHTTAATSAVVRVAVSLGGASCGCRHPMYVFPDSTAAV